LKPRPPIYDRFVADGAFLDPRLLSPTLAVQSRLAACRP